MFISSRLNAALRIEPAGQIEVGEGGSWVILDAAGKVIGEGDGLRCPLATSWRAPMLVLLGFLSAAAEAYGYALRNTGTHPENLDIFNEKVNEWAYENAEDLFLAEFELSAPPEVCIS